MSRWLALGALLASVIAVMFPAGAQSAATCTGAAAPVTFSAEDLEANSQTTLTATHTIEIDLTFNDGGPTVDDTTTQISAPTGVPIFTGGGPVGKRLNLGGGRVAIQPAGPGPVTITAT